MLIYPVTDADFDRPSYVDPENQLLLTREAMVWFWDHYVPDAARRAEPDASPLRAPSLAGLPPAVVLTAEHDVLRDEGEAYADACGPPACPSTSSATPARPTASSRCCMLPGSERGFQQVVKAVRACTIRPRQGQTALQPADRRTTTTDAPGDPRRIDGPPTPRPTETSTPSSSAPGSPGCT